MSNLENKNIIVTGASGGIGNSIIKKLNEAGANILASGTRIEKLEELKKKFKDIKILKPPATHASCTGSTDIRTAANPPNAA